MVEQLQVALGLKEAVSRWCCPPSSPQLVSSEEGREGGIVFLQQLLLLQQLDGSQAPPIPPQLLREEAAEAPKSCTSPHTDSVALLINPYSCSSLNSRINGVHSGASIQQEGAPGVSESPRAPDGPPAGRRSLQQSSNMSYCYAASERHAAFFTSPTLSCRGPLSFGGPEQREEEGMQATAEGEPPEGPQFVAHSDMNAAAMFPDNAGPLLADATSAAVSGAVSAEVQKQRGQQQQQRGQQQQQRPRLSQVVQQQTAAAAATAAKVTKEKGIKRRPEQQGAPRGTSLVAAAAVSPATGPPLQVIGGPVPRGEGPPQKRQAVGKRRGETGAGVRSSSNNSRSKTGGGGFPTKTAAAAASRVSSAGVAENSSSSNSSSCCRVTLSSAKSCPQLQLKQQQDTKSLQESPSDIEAAEDAAAAAALAAARCSSSSSSGDGAEAAVRAFAAEWLRGCQQRLEAMRAKARKESITRSSSSSSSSTGDVSASVSSAAASNTHEELQQAKKQLKQELRSYNISFAAHFGRQPLKQDKEPLRPVYMHYQRIKQRLEQHLAAAEGNSPLVSAAAAVGVGGSAGEGQGSATAATTSLPAVSNVATSNSRRSSTADCSSSSAVAAGAATAAPSPAPTKRQKAPHNLRVPEVLSPKATAHRGRPSGVGPRSPAKASKEKQQQKPVSARPSAYDRQQQQQKRREEMALQLHQLQRERRSLGDKLAAYHLQFKQEHGRPLRLKADIAPVHQEYKLFVEITKQIEALAFALQKQTL